MNKLTLTKAYAPIFCVIVILAIVLLDSRVFCIAKTPFNITLTLAQDTKTSMNFTWQTDASVTSGFIEVKPADREKEHPTVFNAVSAKYENGADVRMVHKVTVTGLKPDTVYKYRCGNGEYFSKEYTFRTAPKYGGETAFIFLTDTQGYTKEHYETWKKVLQSALDRHSDIRFIVHGGDIVDNGPVAQQWDMFLDAEALCYLPIVPTIGNHDYYDGGLKKYQSHFNIQNENDISPLGTTQFINYGDISLAMINTEAGEENLTKQADWLVKSTSASSARWKLAVMHRGIYAATDRSVDVEKAMKESLHKANLDLVLQGHDHIYMRSKRIKNGVEHESGTYYIIGNTAGVKKYNTVNKWWHDFSAQPNLPTYTYIKVNADEMRVITYTLNGEIVDDFTIQKPDGETRGEVDFGSGNKKPTPTPPPKQSQPPEKIPPGGEVIY